MDGHQAALNNINNTTSGSGSAGASIATGGTSTSSVTSSVVAISSDAVLQRLSKYVPAEYLEKGNEGVVEYVKEHGPELRAVIGALFPGLDEVQEVTSPGADEVQGPGTRKEFQNLCRDALKRVQWLMFQGEPHSVLEAAGQGTGSTRGVCGAVWGGNDIAYRCRTCEHDPTCAICVPCFQNGDHATHDYSMIRTGGGCCDCGDVTAWKRSGFCFKHTGPGQVALLPSSLIDAATPVLEALLLHWASTLRAAEKVAENRAKKWDDQKVEEKVACQLSVVCIEMLLEFCSYGESMLAFTAEIVGNRNIGLLDTLMSTECFLPKRCVNSLHELLYKLLGDINFKHTFAQTFISHYPHYVHDAMQEDPTRVGPYPRSRYREHAIVNSFSVQIFTVPTLTPKLVVESSLLDMLFDTLRRFFCSCVGEDGHISVSKVKRHYYRILEDIRYVMTHMEVSQYVAQKRPELGRAWLHFLAFIQGMYPHRRMINIHVEEETEDWGSAYSLEYQMAYIHPLFVAGAAVSSNEDARSKDDSMSDSQSSVPGASDNRSGGKEGNAVDCSLKPNSEAVGTELDVDMCDAALAAADYTDLTAMEFSLQRRSRIESGMESIAGMLVPATLVWLIDECAQILDTWLAVDASREAKKSGQLATDSSSMQSHRRSPRWRGRGGRGVRDSPTQTAAGGPIREWLRRRRVPLEPRVWPEVSLEQAAISTSAGNQAADMDVEMQVSREGWDSRASEWWMGPEGYPSSTIISQLGDSNEWPTMEFDVSRQDVSFHIPLHRMLALLLRKALDFHTAKLEDSSGKDKSSPNYGDNSFLREILPEKYRVPGFAAVVMEHPLRLQVLCAQVQAGMWRRNGHATGALCELYHTVHWCEDSLELDLFLLQCCAVISPCENFVERVIARFSLTDYPNHPLWHPNEYQVTLAQELLILLIRLVSERGFCGLTEKGALRRELVQRLAVGDATHSSLLKALPPRLQDSKHLQECLDAVAAYCNPSGMQQGKYVLRDECWRELDLYHPRWSPRELQSAEERYLRACRAPAVYLQLPRWTQPLPALQSLGQLITTSRIHDMLRSIFFHVAYTEDPSTMELLLHALHLLALALDVCKAQSKSGVKTGADGIHGSSSSNVEDHPPLLLRCMERVTVGRADATATATVIPEPQSMLSLLVFLLRKRGNEGVQEAGSFGLGDLIKKILRSFAELDRGCMYEIESLAPEILHRVSVGTTPKSSGAGDINFKDDISVSESDRRRAIARERQAAAMAKMRAQQERFVTNYKPTEESSGPVKGDETEAKRPKESGGGSDESLEDVQLTQCALCRDATSTSPLCFMVLIQRSKLLAIAEKRTPSWERSLISLQEHVERKGDSSDGPSNATSSDGTRYLHSTAELWQWIQEALGDTQTRTRLLDGEDLLELLRNGPIRNPLRVTPEFLWNWDATAATAATAADTESEEIESSEFTETENNSEAGSSEAAAAAGIVDVNWWEDSESRAGQEENPTNRDVAVATVLAEYVATAVSRTGEPRPQERPRLGRTESPRQAGQEQGRDALTRSRRASARISLAMAEATRYKSNDTVGIHMSACGHAMHQECRDRYFSSLLQRFYNRALFEGVQIVDLEMGEFLCPVCRRLANAILPVLPGQTGLNSTFKTQTVAQPFTSGVSSSPTILQVDHALRLLVKAEELVSRSEFRKVADPQLPDTVKGVLEDLAKRLYGLVYTEKDPFSSPSSGQGHVHQGLLLWDVFRYSLTSAELAARSQKLSVNTDNGLMALVESSQASHGSVLPLLLHAANATQSQSRQAVLLRARGMQLLLDSIVFGLSRDVHANGIKGNYSTLLQYLEKDNDSVDVQLWKRLADPILVHDAFSSFTWLLFCLPLPFPANGAPFTALVHLFYLVSVVQILAQLGSSSALDSELTPSARAFIAAVQKWLAGTVLESSPEDSNVPHASEPSLGLIRRCTLPFLRRCYLLQNLMSHSTQVLPVARAHQWELPQGRRQSVGAELAPVDPKDVEIQELLELEQLDQLESVFLIPPLAKIFEQDAIQQIVQVWCKHVMTDSGLRGIQHSPRVTTASPFKLMELPYLFQDLMQRYVKERCPYCKTVPDKPALCLLCGALCCANSPRPCCSLNRQGECTRHSMRCGAGIGIFLMLRRTNILLQRCGRHAMWPSPYLDAFGEEDLELKRGKPLFLSRERYATLTNMVAAHGLDYSSPVLSQTTRDILY